MLASRRTPPPSPDGRSPAPRASSGRTGRTMSCRSAGRRSRAEDHAVWDLLFARQVELLGTRVVSPFLDGIDLLRLSHPGRPRPRRAERDPGAADRLADGGGAGAGAGRHLLRHAARARVPGRQFHPAARAARLSRGARLLPRHVRPYPDARASRFRGDGRACRAARHGGDRGGRGRARWRGSTGTASSSGWRGRAAS